MVIALLLYLVAGLAGLALAVEFSSGVVSQRELQTSSLVMMFNKDLSQCYLFDPQTNNLLYVAMRVDDDQYKLTAVAIRSPAVSQDADSSTTEELPTASVSAAGSSGAAPEASVDATQGSKPVEFVDVSGSSGAAPEASAVEPQGSKPVEFVDVSGSSGAAPEASVDGTQGSKPVEFVDVSGSSGLTSASVAASSGKLVEFVDFGSSSASADRRRLSAERMTSGQLQSRDLAAMKTKGSSRSKAQIVEAFDPSAGTKIAKKKTSKKFTDSLLLPDSLSMGNVKKGQNFKAKGSKLA